MGDLGRTLREAREAAGLSLTGMAKRTGFSRGYLGNIETGTRQVTPDIIRAYERVLGDDLKRRQLLVGSIAALAATSTPDTAVSIAHDIRQGRNGFLTELQTTHATDKAVAALVARDGGSVASLTKWAQSGKAVRRVNAAGILAKVRSPVIDNDAVAVLRADGDVCELYLTAVIARVLGTSWENASDLAHGNGYLPTREAVQAFTTELTNPADAGARWCSTIMLTRTKDQDPSVADALLSALRTEPSRENLRTIGAALAGADPLNL